MTKDDIINAMSSWVDDEDDTLHREDFDVVADFIINKLNSKCQHEWQQIDKQYTANGSKILIDNCKKCGLTRER